jgi:hypothetical protein
VKFRAYRLRLYTWHGSQETWEFRAQEISASSITAIVLHRGSNSYPSVGPRKWWFYRHTHTHTHTLVKVSRLYEAVDLEQKLK